jgi:hypothetical protein
MNGPLRYRVGRIHVGGCADRPTQVSSQAESTRAVVPPEFVVALDSPTVNPLAIGVMAACDSALLLSLRGQTTIPGARRTIELIVHERLLGAVNASD